jgi:hypothetical protein
MAVMPIHEAMEDDPVDYDDGTAHRARAKMMLDQIARQLRQTPDEQQIDLDLFAGCHRHGTDRTDERIKKGGVSRPLRRC